MSVVIRRYRLPLLSVDSTNALKSRLNDSLVGNSIQELTTEICFNVELTSELDKENESRLNWLLSLPSWKDNYISDQSHLSQCNECDVILEIAPRLNFTTAFSTNAVSISRTISLDQVTRIEISKRYRLAFTFSLVNTKQDVVKLLLPLLHDKMTEFLIDKPIQSFALASLPNRPRHINLLEHGRAALEKVSSELGLAFDSWDLDYYTNLFIERVHRNPTDVECFDLAQSNSEHSRHWFFRGRLIIDGQEKLESLFDAIIGTQKTTNPNNVIQFSDNSSAIQGFFVNALMPDTVGAPARLSPKLRHRHIIFTAETHNFPTGVAPFPGATTGTGGRIRDVQATGRGAHLIAGTAGYSFGNLNLPDYELPWETETQAPFIWPERMAHPVDVAVEGSNGASDYGNKMGEPIVCGFARSCGLMMNNEEWREWLKPIMFTGGVGQIEADHVTKFKPEAGMLVVKIGGPVYRLGVGGGAASSVEVQGQQTEGLDLMAVQRGDAEMEQKMNRVVRACAEALDANPIASIHDQGAGGNGNVLKEICEPAGALIEADEFQLGDPTISLLELWGAEYQESNALLCRSSDRSFLETICTREKCPVSFVGHITGDSRIRLRDFAKGIHRQSISNGGGDTEEKFPVDLELDVVLGKMPRKVFHLDRCQSLLPPLELPSQLKIMECLQRVLRLPSVASKRYLVNKVDRSVTGLIAQQQCVGPLHTPLADMAVVALSHFSYQGCATSIGEQPIKCLVDASCGARLSVAEALTNLALAAVTDLKDVKVSGNWMWPAKLPGEGARLYDACQAMCQLLQDIGVGVDGGKDSLGMAALASSRSGKEKLTVKSPGCLVISAYVNCPDIRKTVTPDLKGNGVLLWINVSSVCAYRLGGSALAQVFGQVGSSCPDIESAEELSSAFCLIQNFVHDGVLLAGHDISDGGWITCLLEMAIAGNCGVFVDLNTTQSTPLLSALFHEEPGWLVEVEPGAVSSVMQICSSMNLPSPIVVGRSLISNTLPEQTTVTIKVNGDTLLDNILVCDLRDIWEETSYRLELRQSSIVCAQAEREALRIAPRASYHITFESSSPLLDPLDHIRMDAAPRVAIIREEGSNCDREMAAAFHMAGFQVWDVTMQDLLTNAVSLDTFKGLAFVGGFSFADVMGSACGWAGGILFHPSLKTQFENFRTRPDTFSLGVCNGCQLMAWIGWVGEMNDDASESSLLLEHNNSGRFESRFPAVRIPDNCKAMMLQGMQGSCLGVWVAHGEGKFTFKNQGLLNECSKKGLVALQYIHPINNEPTDTYPFNPNGSPLGMAGLCSSDGRHLAMMPHPERCVLPWQWPCAWESLEYSRNDSMIATPWIQMFQNAYNWCQNVSSTV